MSADNQNQILNLQGLVRYILSTTDTGQEILNARYVSSRLLQSFQASSAGHGIRQGPNAETRTGFEGNWEIKYFEPTGELAVTAFALGIEKAGEIYYGSWATLDGKPLLKGFGFEEDGKLFMRYGN